MAEIPFLPVSIGPAEVVKITFIILLAWQLNGSGRKKRDLRSFSAAFYVGGHTLGIAGLYFVISGDMGNALMFLLIFVVMSFVAGFALRWFALLFGASGAVIGGIIAFDLVPDSKSICSTASSFCLTIATMSSIQAGSRPEAC